MVNFAFSYDFRAGTPDQDRYFAEEALDRDMSYIYWGYVRRQLHVARLPANIVWGPFVNRDTALTAFNEALEAASARVGHRITVETLLMTRLSQNLLSSNRIKLPDPKYYYSDNFMTCWAHQKFDPFFAY